MPWLCKKMRRPKVGEKKSISLGESVFVSSALLLLVFVHV